MERGAAAGDGGNDADGVAVFGGSIFLGEVTDVLIVDVDVDKTAQLAVLSEEVLAQVGKLGGEMAEGLAHGSSGEFRRIAFARVDAKGSGDDYLNSHEEEPP